jgi:hypothetical protein
MTEDNFRKLSEDYTDSNESGDNVLDVVGLGNAIMANILGSEVAREQESLLNPVHQVFFRAGLLACREYMARFVECESPSIAASIRANWWPSLGKDFGPPRQINWNELTEGEYGEPEFRARTKDEVSPTIEALPIALQFLVSLDSGAALLANGATK